MLKWANMKRVMFSKQKEQRSIDEILEDVEMLIETRFFNAFSETKSSWFLKIIIANQSVIGVGLLKKTWRIQNRTHKTTKVIRENHENILVSASGYNSSRRKTETRCWCSRSRFL